MVIPGVTDVDPGLRQPSMAGAALGTQARMNMLSAVGHAAGPSAQIVSAAAMLAKDSIGGMFKPGTNPEDIGRPSQAALDIEARLGAIGAPGKLMGLAAYGNPEVFRREFRSALRVGIFL